MKRNLQIACGFLSIVFFIEVAALTALHPPQLLKPYLRSLSATATSASVSTLACVSTDPSKVVVPPVLPPPPPPPPPTVFPPASPGTVYAGCAVPGAVSGAKTYYGIPLTEVTQPMVRKLTHGSHSIV
jgi:hypothetical protein